MKNIIKSYKDEQVQCPKCHKKVKPLIKINRLKMDFIGVRYTGKDKVNWLICPICKFVIGIE